MSGLVMDLDITYFNFMIVVMKWCLKNICTFIKESDKFIVFISQRKDNVYKINFSKLVDQKVVYALYGACQKEKIVKISFKTKNIVSTSIPLELLHIYHQRVKQINASAMYSRNIGGDLPSRAGVYWFNDNAGMPRLSLQPSNIPFKFQRRQLSITVWFAMTINKSQEITSRKGLKILITDENGDCINNTINVIYKEVFHNV
ncbi:hypothetical protein MTR_2g062630 [Medicago truncatula]|uniref:Uncharacterized protein n=1 Tax=Medicago truncatula TaxID=3880 RepID=G7IQR3_MEDTR|nr:hypothetical protein MTR_2g062630 [Medicago truncatula]